MQANDEGHRVLGELRNEPKSGAAAELTRLSNEGILFDKLSQAHDKNLRSAEPALIAALILNNPKFDKGTVVGSSEAGYLLATNLAKSLTDRSEIEREIDRYFRAYGAFIELIDAAQANKAIRPLVQNIFAFRVRKDEIGALHVSDVIARLNVYLGYLGADEQKIFIHKLPDYETFWEQFAKAPFSDNVFRIFNELVGLEDDSGNSARNELVRRAAAFTTENWESTLRSAAEPLPLIIGLLKRKELTLDFGEPLSQALHAVVYSAVDGQSVEANLISNWFQISNMLDTYARGIFLKGVRDRVVSTTQPGALQVLIGGGKQLLQVGQFAAKGDEAVRNMLNPLLEKQPDGTNWIAANAGDIAPIVANAEKETKTYIATKLDEFAKGSDEAIAKVGASLIKEWKLENLVPPAVITEDDSNDTKTKEDEKKV